MDSELSATFLGLSAATSWGAGDFSGGIATKKSDVFSVIIISQTIGLSLLIMLALIFLEEFPSLNDIFWGIAAGLSGAIGLTALYHGLAKKSMRIVAPVSAVVAVFIPMLISIIIEGFPEITQLVGFMIGLTAVWLVSVSNEQEIYYFTSLDLPIVAGIGFGFFLVFINQVSKGAIFWPLSIARIASIVMVVLLVIIIGLFRKIELPQKRQLPIIALAGIFDVGGNALFALAAQTGRLDVAAVLSSLYPVVTVLLAAIILKEQIQNKRRVGIILAIVSVILISS